MTGQIRVSTDLAGGVPGSRATLNPVVYLPTVPLAEGEVEAGSFVWPGSDPENRVINGMQPTGTAVIPLTARPDSGSDVPGLFTVTATGADMAGAFSPGSFSASSATAYSLRGTLVFHAPDLEDGALLSGGTALVSVSSGTAQVQHAALTADLGVLTLHGATWNGSGLTLDVEFTLTVAAGRPAGFAERSLSAVNTDAASPGTLRLLDGSPVAVAVRGDFWAVTGTPAVYGDTVFASLRDGSVAAAPAGGSLEGYLETGWIVRSNGAAGDSIIISNWS